ncbi:class I SAM-dependent methyltransferase [Actinacidiphila acididurans]|uniref:Class I SAM-dependent methyltransferase n=1 Tax=Actinacidiphila acididurans TaxID=2784346 RepID=A0ABS2TNH3_9ACTN|nr:class I SAM-dependent methyltransferase [Actinacidiphila acididurans]MBM9503528.1 class I SAM-dependent methyltransferase [Actinacidiphila acididurans]
MSVSRALRNRFVDAPGSLGERLRLSRWEVMRRWFPGIEDMTVVDLGGTADMWLRAPLRPAHVHLVNLEPHPEGLPDWITAQNGDVTDPKVAAGLGSYDLVFSNSTIEHVGGHSQRRRFAEAVTGLAPRHWVQTPYRYFPVEPHFVAPGFQFLPLAARARLVRRWPLTHSRPGSPREGMEAVVGIELLTRVEMSYLFPDSVILPERVLGLTKSLVALRVVPGQGPAAASRD